MSTETITDEPRTVSAAEKRSAKIQGLRDLADFLEAHPDTKPPESLYALEGCDDAEQLAMRARALGGRWDKGASGEWFELRRHFGPYRYELYASRAAVCEAVVVGSEEVEVTEPDPELLAAVPQVTRTVTRDVVEWRCPQLLGGGGEE